MIGRDLCRVFHRKQLSVVRKEVPMLFTKATETVHKLGFPDVILPGRERERERETHRHAYR